MSAEGEQKREWTAEELEERKKYIATDEEFKHFLDIMDSDDGFTVVSDDQKKHLKVLTKPAPDTPIAAIKVETYYEDLEPEVVYDALHDHYFRRTWDDHMIEGSIIEQVDPFNEVGYYSCKMPFPIANRDYCNHRSWKVFPERKTWVIFNKSVLHPDCPVEPKFTRGWSFFSGYYLQKREEGGCIMKYYTHNDPRGWLPTLAINLVSQKVAPSLLTQLHENALKYPDWKKNNHPDWKPWLTGFDVHEKPYCQHVPTPEAIKNAEKEKAAKAASK